VGIEDPDIPPQSLSFLQLLRELRRRISTARDQVFTFTENAKEELNKALARQMEGFGMETA